MQFHLMTLLDVLGQIRFSIPGQNLRYPYLVCKKYISYTLTHGAGIQKNRGYSFEHPKLVGTDGTQLLSLPVGLLSLQYLVLCSIESLSLLYLLFIS